jgi:hypothetical protein
MAQPHHGIEDRSKPAIVVLEVEPVELPELLPVAALPAAGAPDEVIIV